MTVTVVGLGHFANTAATALALKGYSVDQFDLEPPLVREGQMEREPNWPAVHIARVSAATGNVVWIAYDTPLDASGRGAVGLVTARIGDVCTTLEAGTTVLLSSQWPVGTTASIAAKFPDLVFLYVVENVRVGHALDDFLHQSRIVIGAPQTIETWRVEQVEGLLCFVTKHVEWMSVESAEMSKHALNAFLALQIAFINEVDTLGKRYGAEGGDVARALLGDDRVSPQAYLKPGRPFGGGSLQRDLITLNELAADAKIQTPVLSAIIPSNDGYRP